MTNKMDFVVNGFVFDNEEEYKQAQKEYDGVKFLKSKLNKDNPESVLDIYNRAIEQKLFETVIGILFLKELQEYLTAIPYLKKEQIDFIPVAPKQVIKAPKEKEKKEKPVKEKPQKEKRIKEKNVDYKNRFSIVFVINLSLVLIILGMFFVTIFSHNNVTILNYENELIDRYEEWEQELEEREAELDAREQALEDAE